MLPYTRNWLLIALAAILAALAGASALIPLQPAQAKTDEKWIIPETISAGKYHTCGVRGDGTLACWGDNQFGQLNFCRIYLPLLQRN